MKGYFVDLSQALERKTFSCQSKALPTMTTSTLLYSYDQDAAVVGRDMLNMQGQPKAVVVPGDIKDHVLRDLAGEGMAVPCVGLIVWCLFLTRQFP